MARKIDVREKLLSAGLEALHKRGFNATGVQDIVDAAQVPKGSFYNYFASKDALGVEVVKHYTALGEERRQSMVDGTGAPLARLRSYFKTLNELGPANGYSCGCLLGNFGAELSSQSADIRTALDEALDGWTKDIARVIVEAQKTGDVSRNLPANTLAAFLLNAWQGAVIRSKVEKSSAPLDAFMSVAFSKILT